jgi:hypothetical protein
MGTLIEKFIVAQLFKRFSVFHETRKFIAGFMTAHHWMYPQPHLHDPRPHTITF